jgi:hypothetical protein
VNRVAPALAARRFALRLGVRTDGHVSGSGLGMVRFRYTPRKASQFTHKCQSLGQGLEEQHAKRCNRRSQKRELDAELKRGTGVRTGARLRSRCRLDNEFIENDNKQD